MTNAAIEKALISEMGNLAAVARKLKMRRGALLDRINTSPDLTVTLDDRREEVIDTAQSNMFTATMAGDLKASKFILTTIGKERGYQTSLAHTGPDGKGPIKAEVAYVAVKAPDYENGEAAV